MLLIDLVLFTLDEQFFIDSRWAHVRADEEGDHTEQDDHEVLQQDDLVSAGGRFLISVSYKKLNHRRKDERQTRRR